MNYPQEWGIFCQWRKKYPDIPLPENINSSELNRFAARFRLAQSYQGINLKDYQEITAEAYSSLFGLFLAYSALEQLYKAVGRPNKFIETEWAISKPKIANKLRKATGILTFLENNTNRTLREKIGEFQKGDNHNILVIAQGMRHLVAHGIMTVHSGNVKPKTTIKFCDLVKQCINKKTQICFTEYVFDVVVKQS